MFTIGIFADINTHEIEQAVMHFLRKSSKPVISIVNSYDIETKIRIYKSAGFEYAIILFFENAFYVPLDILIIDTKPNRNIIPKALIDCIGTDTKIIYNADNGYLPKLDFLDAIDYGFSMQSGVCISSIEYDAQDEYTLMLYVNSSFKLLNGNICDIGEIPITYNSHIKCENLLPAAICSILCEATNSNMIKI